MNSIAYTTEQLQHIDDYVRQLCVPEDAALEETLRHSTAAGLPEINVSPNEGKLLFMLARVAGARRILEIGLLGGYSALWLARALPADGRLVSLEVDAHHAEVARQNLERAGVAAKVEIRVGDGQALLKEMITSAEAPFDVVFIDADKANYPMYLDYALQLTHPGSLILGDNVIRRGTVADDAAGDPGVQGIQEFNRRLAGNPKLETILLPIIRGDVDGLAIARVTD